MALGWGSAWSPVGPPGVYVPRIALASYIHGLLISYELVGAFPVVTVGGTCWCILALLCSEIPTRPCMYTYIYIYIYIMKLYDV